jgi:hypothetical protein
MDNMADGGSMIHTFSTSGNETLQNNLSGELVTTRIDTNGRNTVVFSKTSRRIAEIFPLSIAIRFVKLQYCMMRSACVKRVESQRQMNKYETIVDSRLASCISKKLHVNGLAVYFAVHLNSRFHSRGTNIMY